MDKTGFTIAFGHRKRSGKDTAGAYLKEAYGFKTFGFADMPKLSAMLLCGFTVDQLWGDGKDIVDLRWGYSPRWFLQHYATEVTREIDTQFWIRSFHTAAEQVSLILDVAMRQLQMNKLLSTSDEKFLLDKFGQFPIKDTDDLAFTDTRYPNEAEYAVGRNQRGVTCRIDRPGMMKSDDTHSSENSMDDYAYHTVIANDGTLDSFHKKLDQFLLTDSGWSPK